MFALQQIQIEKLSLNISCIFIISSETPHQDKVTKALEVY